MILAKPFMRKIGIWRLVTTLFWSVTVIYPVKLNSFLWGNLIGYIAVTPGLNGIGTCHKDGEISAFPMVVLGCALLSA